MRLSRTYNPEITASEKIVKKYINNMSEIVEKYYSTNLRRDLRMADYIRRIPLSIARSSFSSVNNEIIEEAGNIIEDSINTWNE